MAKCCMNCFDDIGLKNKIKAESTFGRCSFCKTQDACCVDPQILADDFEFLLYSFEESENGDSLVDVLNDSCQIISDAVTNQHALLAQIIGQNKASKNYKFKYETQAHLTAWNELKVELKHQNRFFPKHSIYSSLFGVAATESSGDLDIFYALLEQISLPVLKDDGEPFFRARIAEQRLNKDKMGAPPNNLASAGRANPRGIAYLYLAENLETCIAEVRPAKGSGVCVSAVTLTADVVFLNLSEPRRSVSVTEVAENRHQQFFTYLAFLENLSGELSQSILPDNSDLEYIPSQFLCEFIKSIGKFDGLIFNSSFGTGKNYVLFDPRNAEIEEPNQYTITATSYEFETA